MASTGLCVSTKRVVFRVRRRARSSCLVPIVNSELDENMEFAHSPSNLPSGAKPTSSLGRRRIGDLQISNRPPGGEPCTAALTRCFTSLGEAAKADHSRSTFVASLSQVWVDWRYSLLMLKPGTVIGWHRKGFRMFWTWKVRRG